MKQEQDRGVRCSAWLGGHVMMTPAICPCDKASDIPCPVCDWGLAVCCVCGAAENELDKEGCSKVDVGEMAAALHECLKALVSIEQHFAEYGKGAGPFRDLRRRVCMALAQPPNDPSSATRSQ